MGTLICFFGLDRVSSTKKRKKKKKKKKKKKLANKNVTDWGGGRRRLGILEKARRRAFSPLRLKVTHAKPRARRPPRAGARPPSGHDTTARTSATRRPFPSDSPRAPC